jgi:hypothetical protein
MQDGGRVRRRGWNGKGMWLAIEQPRGLGMGMTVPFVFMKTADEQKVPWLCSQTDLLAIDWETA